MNCKWPVRYPVGYQHRHKCLFAPVYIKLVQRVPKFNKLRDKLARGQNLLIIDNGSVRANRKNLSILVNDDKHPFGHGYCLAMALLGLTVDDLGEIDDNARI